MLTGDAAAHWHLHSARSQMRGSGVPAAVTPVRVQDQAWLRALLADAALNRFKHLEASAGLRSSSIPGGLGQKRDGKRAAAGKSWDDLGQALHAAASHDRMSPFDIQVRLRVGSRLQELASTTAYSFLEASRISGATDSRPQS